MSDKHNKRAPFPQRRLLASAIGLALASGFAVAQDSTVELDSVTVKGQQDQGYKVDKASSPKQTDQHHPRGAVSRAERAHPDRCTEEHPRHQLQRR